MEDKIIEYLTGKIGPCVGMARRTLMAQADRWECTTYSINIALKNLEYSHVVERVRVKGMVYYKPGNMWGL